MVNWQSPGTIAANAASNAKFLHALLGIYLWDWINTIEYDLAIITRGRKFRWPLIFYFYGRYAMLATLIGFIVSLDVREEIDCQALYQTLQVLSNTALGVASINLAVHTITIWGHPRYLSTALILLVTGQFGIIIRSMFHVKATFIPGAGCTAFSTESTISAAMYIYAMIVDLILLVLTGYKLLSQPHGGFMRLLFGDGLFYFIFAFIGNLIAVIFSLLDLNSVMVLIANVPATTFATISACTIIRLKFCESDLDNRPSIAVASLPVSRNPGMTGGVRVEMTTFTHAESVSITLDNAQDPTASTGAVLEEQKAYGHDAIRG